MNSEDNGHQYLGIVIEELDTLDLSKNITGSDLRGHQEFPFIPGFRKI